MPKARVMKIIDGDTFKIPRKVIRLANVYAPEMGTKGGSQAKADLKNLIKDGAEHLARESGAECLHGKASATCM